MNRRKIVLLLFLLPALSFGQNVKFKMIHMQSPAVGRYMLHILPQLYDSTITDEQIARCVDTMPGHLFNAKMYNMVYKDDTTRLAVKINEGTYFFHTRYTLILYWKNGNKKRVAYISKHFNKYHEYNYAVNDAPLAFGRYRKGHKKGRWVYFNTQGRKVKVEKYARDGTLKNTKTFDPPKKTLRTTFNPRHPGGTPYIIQ